MMTCFIACLARREDVGYKSDIAKAERRTDSEEFPQTIVVENCSACNLKCSMCDHKNISKYREIRLMEPELYKTDC